MLKKFKIKLENTFYWSVGKQPVQIFEIAKHTSLKKNKSQC